jgi:hypothetical protein
MMLVTLSLEYCRTRFQTLITSPQVVSTSSHPLAINFFRLHFRAERRDDDDIPRFQPGQFLLRGLGRNDLDAHVANLVVDLRVVDDFAQQINGFGRRETRRAA